MFKLSLSAVLPVCNDQANLSRRLSCLLEVLPELAARFDVAVIDHGSGDATAEVAHEIAAGYPQLCVLSHPRPLDYSTVLRTGLQATSGELVLFWLDPAADPHDFHRLVKAAGGVDAVAGRLPPPVPGAAAVASRDASQQPSLLLFHRRVATAWRTTQTDESLLNYLLRKRYRVAELLIRRAIDNRLHRSTASLTSPPAMHAGRSSKRTGAVPQPRASFGSPLGRSTLPRSGPS